MFLLTKLVKHLREKVKDAPVDEQEAKTQHVAGERVLTRVRDEKNKLQDSNTLLGEGLKDVRAQLDDAIKEDRRLQGGIFSMFLILPLCISAKK